tara:strand:+ start:16 stop:312 length:297 start_codon:yes stop_codon:yes gene_type:complete
MENIILGIILAIIYSYIILPREEKGKPKLDINIKGFIKNGMIIFEYKKYIFHIHHWIICLLLLIFFQKYLHNIINGLLIGLFIQGLLYKDCFEIIKKK